MNRARWLAGIWAILLLISCRQVSAQFGKPDTESPAATASKSTEDDREAAGDIAGTVRDPSGAIVLGARVSIADANAQSARHMLTDQQGRYLFTGVPAGRYRLVGEYSGFARVEKNVVVSAKQTAVVDITLSIASTNTFVVVQEQASDVSPSVIASGQIRTNDTASLIDDVPGFSLYANGGVSSLPVIHGLADDRVKTTVDGMTISPHCANHMNPVLSYIAPVNVAAIHIVEGVTPVSQGGDSIAGSISVESPVPDFSPEKIVMHGGVSGFYRSNGMVDGGNAFWSLASKRFTLGYNISYVNAEDYTSGSGDRVRTSLYQAQNQALTLATQFGNHQLTVRLGYQDIPEQGFPTDYMDMTKNNGVLFNLLYQGKYSWGVVAARFYDERTRHEMNSLPQRGGMDMPMNVKGGDVGYSVSAELPIFSHDILRVGTDFNSYTLNDWWPPVTESVSPMGPLTFWNVRNGWRDRFGTFAEWELHRGQRWGAVLGVRNDVVLMNTGDVTGYNMNPTTTGSAAYYADATAFNQQNHYRVDNNFDWTALARYQANSRFSFEAGYSRKTRSPSLYERYLWAKESLMAVEMNGWFLDGNGYVGNLNLHPEVAHTTSLGVAWHRSEDSQAQLTITPYYTYVQNYINVVRCPPIASSNSCTLARYQSTSGYVTLQFANQSAQIAGVDVSGRLPLGNYESVGKFAFSGVFSYLHGRNPITDEYLYNIMPTNLRLALEHQRGAWSNRITLLAVDAKNDVEAVRNELSTPGYALLNLQSSYQLNLARGTKLRFDFGIENLTNQNYALPLGGRYWVDNTGSTQLAGPGRSFIGGLTFGF